VVPIGTWRFLGPHWELCKENDAIEAQVHRGGGARKQTQQVKMLGEINWEHHWSLCLVRVATVLLLTVMSTFGGRE
jgi:hypothetical protein